MNQSITDSANPELNSDPVALNEQGVSWLCYGGNQEAVAYFKNALVTMKASLHQVPEHQQNLQDTTRSSPASRYNSVSLPGSTAAEDKYYIYTHALVFASRPGGGILQDDYALYSALVLFNIALAHHLQANKTHEDGALREAAYFYSMCLQILSSVEPFCPNKGTVAPIKLAALNNLAVIHYEQGNARKAHSILKETYYLLSPEYLQGLDGQAFDQEDFDGITLNAVMMKWTFVAPCA